MKKLFWAILLSVFLATSAFAGQMLPYPKFRAADSLGNAYSGGKLYTYTAGTSTAKAAYTDVNLTTAAANPIILDSNGEATVYLKGKYKLILKTSADVTIWTLDNVQGMGDWEEGKYYVDASETDQGVTGSGNSIAAHLATIGSEKAILKLANTSATGTTNYTISTSITIPANVHLEIEPGSLLVKGTGSPKITLNGTGTYQFWLRQIFSGWGAGDILGLVQAYPHLWGVIFDGTTDDTAAWASVLLWFNTVETGQAQYKSLDMPAGKTLITDAVPAFTTATGYSVRGKGRYQTIFTAGGSTGYTALTFGNPLPNTSATNIYGAKIEGFGVIKSGTGQRTGIRLNGWYKGLVFDIASIMGDTATGDGDIGLAYYGHAENNFFGIELKASTPLLLSSDDSTIAGNGIDQTNFHGLALYSTTNAHPLIKQEAGTVFGTISFTGQQTWVGGNAGFSHDGTADDGSNCGMITFENVRREDNTAVAATRASGYTIDIQLHASRTTQKLIVRGGAFTVTSGTYALNGIRSTSAYNNILVEGYTDNGGSGHVFMTATANTNTDAVTLLDCNFGSATVSLTNFTKVLQIGNNYFYKSNTIGATRSLILTAGLPTYADNTAALAGGLVAGELYVTAAGAVMRTY